MISQPGDEYDVLVKFLLDMGADPNVMRVPTREDSLEYLGSCQGTTCDQLVHPVVQGLSGPFGQSPLIMKILERVQDAGGHSSRPYVSTLHPSYRSSYFPREAKQLTIFEDHIDSAFAFVSSDASTSLTSSSFRSWGACASDPATR